MNYWRLSKDGHWDCAAWEVYPENGAWWARFALDDKPYFEPFATAADAKKWCNKASKDYTAGF